MNQSQKQMVELEEFAAVCRERDAAKEDAEIYQNQARKLDEICRGLRQKEQDLLAAIIKHTNHASELQKELEKALQEATCQRKRAQEAEERAVQLQEQIGVHEEVVERIRAQNCRFVEEQREAKHRADVTAASLIKAKDEVARLVKLNDSFKEQLAKVTQELNALQADYDARGKVIKKLRKRLHKLKKKLKH